MIEAVYCSVWACSRGIFSEVVFLIFSKVLFLIFSEVVFLSEERECISAAAFLHCVARPILSSPPLLCFLLYPCFSSLSKIWILKQTLTPKISQYVFFGIIFCTLTISTFELPSSRESPELHSCCCCNCKQPAS